VNKRDTAVLLVVGLIAGIASGLFGVGGGIVMVPLLVWLMRSNQHGAHATSLAAIVPIAIAGAATFALNGEIDYPLAAGLAAGSVIGAPIGVRAMAATGEQSLRILFGILQIGVGLLLLFTG
jgi:uncharacterized membrane protein YfcA